MSDQSSEIAYGCACAACAAGATQNAAQYLVGGGQGGSGVSLTYAQAADEITRGGFSWSAADGVSPGIVTYGYRFNDDPNDFSLNFTRTNITQQAAIDTALGLWSDVANIWFQKVGGAAGGLSYTDAASILISTYNENDGANGYAYLPTGNRTGTAMDGDVYLNLFYGDTFGLTLGTYGWLTVIHELGHAIGLEHPGDYNGSGTYAASAGYREDTRQYSLMSYYDAYFTGANHNTGTQYLYASTPLLHDIAAAQELYGANWYTRTGDTCYGFYSNADRSAFRLSSAADDRVFAVWDAGGYDTFNFSLYATNQFIDLNPGAFSSTGRLTNNVAIAEGAIIEAALGGSGADVLYGNAADNALYGGLGNDWFWGRGGSDYIDGGAGYDIAIYEGGYARYALAKYGTTIFVFDGTTGAADALVGVDAVTFSEGPLQALDLQTAARAPGFVATTQSAATVFAGTSTPLSNWFTGGSYFANVGIYGYLVKDSGAGAGALQLYGSYITPGTARYVSAADFANLNYVGGTSGTDQITVQAYLNDNTYSNTASIAVTSRGALATITASTAVFGIDFPSPITVSLTQAFAVSSPAVAVTSYAVNFQGEGVLRLAGGGTIAAGQWTYLTATQYAGATVSTTGQGGTLSIAAIDALGGVSNFASKAIGPVDMPNTAATTASLVPGQVYYGQIATAGDTDWIAMRLDPGVYSFGLRGSPSGSGTLTDPYLRLLDAWGNELAADDDNGIAAGNASAVVQITYSGTYFLEASGFGTATGTYAALAQQGFVTL